MSRTYGKKGPQLSRVPGERAVQQYVLALTAAFVVFFLTGVVAGIVTFARFGGNPTVAQGDVTARSLHYSALTFVDGVLISLVAVAGIFVTLRNRDQIRTVSGLKTQYVLAGLVTMFYSVWPRGWGGTAAGLVIVIVALLTKTVPAEQRTGRIEWPDGGAR